MAETKAKAPADKFDYEVELSLGLGDNKQVLFEDTLDKLWSDGVFKLDKPVTTRQFRLADDAGVAMLTVKIKRVKQ